MSVKPVIFGCSGKALTQDEKDFFHKSIPWGIILFKRNIENPNQLKDLTASIRDATSRNIPILVDQEGGRVERLTKPNWRSWMSALQQMTILPEEVVDRAMWLRYRLIGEELKEVGISVNCAPVGDLACKFTHPILLNRCYGETLRQVVPAARACADGLISAGILPVLKHIPGHGRATVDSHFKLPKVSTTLKELNNSDFKVFEALNDISLGMTAHVLYDNIDAEFPATQSKEVIKIVRDKIKFKGLLMTDDISMKALTGSLVDKVQGSLEAGCDLILHCNGIMTEMIEVADCCSVLNPERKKYSDMILREKKAEKSTDVRELANEYDTLLQKYGSAVMQKEDF